MYLLVLGVQKTGSISFFLRVTTPSLALEFTLEPNCSGLNFKTRYQNLFFFFRLFLRFRNSIVTSTLQSRCDELPGVSLCGLECGPICIFQSTKSRHPANSHFFDRPFVCHKSEEDKEPWKKFLPQLTRYQSGQLHMFPYLLGTDIYYYYYTSD